ncbi:thiol-disulfide oxidoreductase DCC family protein [Planctomycetes bacterium K23_9]|uniref:Thiol-disulfide oxidoreductase n=1 Tax=Stieleria marina TaxID=1930275 RepID=A0A517NYS5_9BACT|nr:hypothetical protein K239x_42620 [Planctomycetes bacterium K23_9]
MSISSQSLPDPDQTPGTDVVIYDGDCRFCTGGVKRLRQLDRFGPRLSFISLHDPRVAERYPDLGHDDLMNEMFVVDTDGNRHGGADAVRYLSRRLPLLWIAAPILYLPGTANLWRWLYRQVAKRRYKIAGKNCENDACSIHFD